MSYTYAYYYWSFYQVDRELHGTYVTDWLRFAKHHQEFDMYIVYLCGNITGNELSKSSLGLV